MHKKYLALLFIQFAFVTFASSSHAANHCSSLFLTTPYTADQSLGEQIFTRGLKRVQNDFTQLHELAWPEQVDQLLAKDSRKIFFHLRVLAQSYESFDASFFSHKVDLFKKFEFLLGRVRLYRDLQALTLEIKEPELETYFKAQEALASQELKVHAEELGILQNPELAIEKMTNDFTQYKAWPNAKVDRNFLINETINFIKDLNDNIKDKKYSNEDIEKGLHRLRRKLRELGLRIGNLDGLAKLIENENLPAKLNAWYLVLKAKNPKIDRNSYMPLSPPEISSPILIGAKSLAILSELVSEIGLSKDKYEPLARIETAINSGTFSEQTGARVMAKVQALRAKLGNQVQIADQYQEQIHHSKLLDAIIEFLREQN